MKKKTTLRFKIEVDIPFKLHKDEKVNESFIEQIEDHITYHNFDNLPLDYVNDKVDIQEYTGKAKFKILSRIFI